jgi:hypothetical protein
MKPIIDNISGPTGVAGIITAKVNDPELLFSFIPSTPSEYLIFFSTCLVICQLVHWGWRFLKWRKLI